MSIGLTNSNFPSEPCSGAVGFPSEALDLMRAHDENQGSISRLHEPRYYRSSTMVVNPMDGLLDEFPGAYDSLSQVVEPSPFCQT